MFALKRAQVMNGEWGVLPIEITQTHDDVIKWKHFPRNWPFVLGIHRSPVNSPHKGQFRGALMFSLICVWINSWVNNREAGELRRNQAHYDVIVMRSTIISGHMWASQLSERSWLNILSDTESIQRHVITYSWHAFCNTITSPCRSCQKGHVSEAKWICCEIYVLSIYPKTTDVKISRFTDESRTPISPKKLDLKLTPSTHWGLANIADICQTIFSNVFL